MTRQTREIVGSTFNSECTTGHLRKEVYCQQGQLCKAGTVSLERLEVTLTMALAPRPEQVDHKLHSYDDGKELKQRRGKRM